MLKFQSICPIKKKRKFMLTDQIKADIKTVVDSFADALNRLAFKDDSSYSVSANKVSFDLSRRILQKKATEYINAFEDVWNAHMDVYIALLQESSKSIKDVEVKKYTDMALDLRKNQIVTALRILNVKAESLLEEARIQEVSLKEASKLLKLQDIKIDDLIKDWHEEIFPLD